MRYLNFFFAVIIIMILSSCSNNKNDSILEIKYSINNMPTKLEYQNLTEEELAIVNDIICNINTEDLESLLKKTIENFFNDYPQIQLTILSVYKDDLLIVNGKKPFNNFIINIEFAFDSNDMKYEESSDYITEISRNFYRFLSASNPIYDYNINRITSSFIDTESQLNNAINKNIPSIFSMFVVNQSVEELQAQEIIFNHSQQYEETYLARFGAIAETSELYIEILSYKPIITDISDYFNTYSKKILEKLYADPIAYKYIIDNNLNYITVVFYTPWYDDEYITYNYDIVKNNK